MTNFFQDVSKGIGKAAKAATLQQKFENRSNNLDEKQAQLAAREADIKNKYQQTLDRQTQKQQALQEKEAQYDQKMQRDQYMAAKAAEKMQREQDIAAKAAEKGPAPNPTEPSSSFSSMNPSYAVNDDLVSAMKTMGMKRGGNVQTTRMSTVQRSKKSSNW